jgi:hypothetical protein
MDTVAHSAIAPDPKGCAWLSASAQVEAAPIPGGQAASEDHVSAAPDEHGAAHKPGTRE